ncbi:MAG TPA: PDZ domain-containing protein, partial [Puia sp.]|nr:PDZ domain-containing protein [Puia sp.]
DRIPTNFDVVGIILRPETGGQYSILGIADNQGKSSVPGIKVGDVLIAIDNRPVTGLTMGAVWDMLKGEPGSIRTLTIDRGQSRFKVKVKVQRFL